MNAAEIDQHDVELVDDVVEQLELDEPVLRVALIESARARIAGGHGPSALDLAGTLVAHFA